MDLTINQFNEAIRNLPTALATLGDAETVVVSKDTVLRVANSCFHTLSAIFSQLKDSAADLGNALAGKTAELLTVTEENAFLKRSLQQTNELMESVATTLASTTTKLLNTHEVLKGIALKRIALDVKDMITKLRVDLPEKILELGKYSTIISGAGAAAVVVGVAGNHFVHKDSTYKKRFFNLVALAGFAAMLFATYNVHVGTKAIANWAIAK